MQTHHLMKAILAILVLLCVLEAAQLFLRQGEVYVIRRHPLESGSMVASPATESQRAQLRILDDASREKSK